MKSIEVIARGVLVENQHLLVCKNKKKDYFYLPGGHVEFWELTQNALQREWEEELGTTCIIHQFLTFQEDRFVDKNQIKHHEYTFIYQVFCDTLTLNSPLPQIESHLEFFWLPFINLFESYLLPRSSKDFLLDFLK